MGLKLPNEDPLAVGENTAMNKQFVLKADKEDVEKLQKNKSNKIDTDNMLDVQQIMQNQLRHILVLFIEIVKI